MTMDTLPNWLNYQATSYGHRIAIRHKQLGIWHEATWQTVNKQVLSLVHLLQNKGFTAGDTLYILSHPRPEALLLSIAAQWLGGVAAPIDPNDDPVNILHLLHQLHAVYVFAEGQLQVDLLLQLERQPDLVIYADQRGLAAYSQPSLQYYAQPDIAPVLELASKATPEQDAFAFFRIGQNGHIEVQLLMHREMLIQGRELVAHESLTQQEEALAARAFAASGHVRYLLAPWLLAGFRLNFPENIQTRDADRRELGPTLVAGTKQTYERLEALVRSRLPAAGTWLRAAFDWAVRVKQKGASLPAVYLANYIWLYPLRDVIGFTRTRVPLLVGEPLSDSSLSFFAVLGIAVRRWPETPAWQKLDSEPFSTSPVSSYRAHRTSTNAKPAAAEVSL